MSQEHKNLHYVVVCRISARSGHAKIILDATSFVFDDHAMAKPLCPVVDTWHLAISCSRYPIPQLGISKTYYLHVIGWVLTSNASSTFFVGCMSNVLNNGCLTNQNCGSRAKWSGIGSCFQCWRLIHLEKKVIELGSASLSKKLCIYD